MFKYTIYGEVSRDETSFDVESEEELTEDELEEACLEYWYELANQAVSTWWEKKE